MIDVGDDGHVSDVGGLVLCGWEGVVKEVGLKGVGERRRVRGVQGRTREGRGGKDEREYTYDQPQSRFGSLPFGPFSLSQIEKGKGTYHAM